MKIDFEPSQEGSCLLYDATGKSRSFFGVNPRKKLIQPKSNKPMIGYLAYPNVTLKNDIPPAVFYEYDRLEVIPAEAGIWQIPDCSGMTFGQIPNRGNDVGQYSTSGKLQQSVTKSEYIQKIKQIKELLAAGEVYQINYAIRFRKKFKGDPYALFLKLAKANLAPYSAYLNCGNFQILSSSPEQLFKVQKWKITTRPIKGTAPKSGGAQALKNLLASEKERAELDMITDLERNDIGKICRYGTLELIKEREVMELPNLWHTYSEVQGKLAPHTGFNDVMSALFPGGSITGCPKLRAMEHIEKLEGYPRNIFTGSIGYLAEGGSQMEFNIAIRTALVRNGIIEYWAGGGIVADSDPEKEYAECMLKAERFLQLL